MSTKTVPAEVDLYEQACQPCPFCGYRGFTVGDALMTGTESTAWIQCPNCTARGPQAFEGCRADEPIDLEEEAARFWQERTG